jgi:drug/metabolite transporter (DMT)-like permease
VNNNKIRIYGAIVLAMTFWAFSFVWYKIASQSFRPITIVFIRLVISVIILFTYLAVKKKFVAIRKEHRKLFLILALFEPFSYFIGESFGLTYVSATVGSVVISTIPVVATVGAWLIFKERLRVINYAGIVLSFIGILIFILNRNGSISFSTKGLLLLILAVFSAVGYNLTLTRLVGAYSPAFIVSVQNLIGASLFLPLFLLFDLKEFLSGPFDPVSFLPILELAVFASCGAFILFAFSVRNIGITRANVFTNFIPVLTAIISFILMGDKLTLQHIAGMIVVLAGIFMSQINGGPKKTGDALILTGKTA